MNRPKPALRVELLFYLTFLAAFAILVGVATSQFALSIAPERGVFLVIVFIAVEVGIFVLYGRSLVSRLVLRPLDRVVATADAVADGDLAARAPDADTRDFATLAERLNRMTDRLLDAQSQLVRSEKLASIGRLAAGVAHEVGNPLGAAGTYLEVLRRRGADPEVTEGIARELERLDRIVRSLLDYARPHEDTLVPVDPSRCLRAAPGTRRVSQRACGDRRRPSRPRDHGPRARPGADTRQPAAQRGGRDAGRGIDHHRGSALGLRAGTIASEARHRSGLRAVSPYVRAAAGARRVCRWTAGRAALRRRLGTRRHA